MTLLIGVGISAFWAGTKCADSPPRWRSVRDEPPTADDADAFGCVLVKDSRGRVDSDEWDYVGACKSYVQWMPVPGGKDGWK
jgi:hypothetical protein